MDTKALRQKILDLAIRGKLVPQDPNDESASVLLERIRAEKQQMVKDGKLKAKDIKNDTVIFKGDDNLHYEKFSDGTVKCIEDEIPFELPEGWKWTRLGCITDVIQYGLSNSAESTGDYRLLRITDIQNGCVNWDTVPFTSTDEPEKYLLHKDDIVFARTGATVGKSFLITDLPYASVYASYLIRIRLINGISANYIYHFFNSYCYWEQVTDKAVGVGQPNCNGTALRELFIPLPSQAEQNRIVPVADNLLKIVDTITSEQESLSELIQTTKSKILDLAIRGKLVPQDLNDEPASILLERIRAEKDELIKQGKIKRDKKESVIFKGDDNSYYQDLPNCWSVCKLCEISYFERGITFPASAKETVPTDRNIACARTANVQDLFDISNLIYVDRSFMKDNPDKLLKVNDIIVSTANSLELVGKSCIVEKLLEKMTFGGFVTVVRGIGINHKYIHMCLKNKFLKGEFSYKSTQTTNIANISTKDLAETIIYLPPLAEQRRIVNAVETLFAQIDKIAEQIS